MHTPTHITPTPTHPPHPPELRDGHAGEPLHRHARADLHGGPARQRVGHRGGQGEREGEGDAISLPPAAVIVVVIVGGGRCGGGFGQFGGREVDVGHVAEAEAPEAELEVLYMCVFGGLGWHLGMVFELRRFGIGSKTPTLCIHQAHTRKS